MAVELPSNILEIMFGVGAAVTGIAVLGVLRLIKKNRNSENDLPIQHDTKPSRPRPTGQRYRHP